MDISRSEKVTKKDAARRQLHTAVRLFFAEEDSIAVYTIAGAAHELLRTLVKRQGGSSFIVDSEFIRPERRQEWFKIMNRPRNFFKHSDRDPDDVLDFKPDTTAMWLFDCVIMYGRLTGEWTKECKVFHVWFMVTFPEMIAREKMPQQVRDEYEAILPLTQDGEYSKSIFLEILNYP